MNNNQKLEWLNGRVHGHIQAKKVLINMLNRVEARYAQLLFNETTDIDIPSTFLIGDSGTGKTHLVNTIAELYKYPVFHVDATILGPSGTSSKSAEKLIKEITAFCDKYSKDNPIEYPTARCVEAKLIIFIDECFPGDVEILTSDGFVRFDELKDTHIVAQYHADETIDFVKPDRLVKKWFKGDLILDANKRGSHISTPNHKRVYRDPSGDICFKKAHEDVPSNYTVPTDGYYLREEADVSDDWLRLMVAFHADGCIKKVPDCKNSYGCITFKKDRKISRFKHLLMQTKLPYSETIQDSHPEYTHFYLGKLEDKGLYSLTKGFSREFLLSLSLRQRKVLIEELFLWDGYIKDSVKQIFSSKKDQIDLIQEVMTLSGYRASVKARKKEGYKDNYVLTNISQEKGTQRREIHNIAYEDDVYCVTVPTGMIITRYNGNVMVSGNCDKLSISHDSSGNWHTMTQSCILTLIEGRAPVFIFAGAFSKDKSLRNTESTDSRSMGFLTNNNQNTTNDEDLPEKIIKAGLIPELVGRIGHFCLLDKLTHDNYLSILDNHLLPDINKTFTALNKPPITLTDEFREEICKKAYQSSTGVRYLKQSLSTFVIEYEFENESTDSYDYKQELMDECDLLEIVEFLDKPQGQS